MASFPQKSLLAPLRGSTVRTYAFHLVRVESDWGWQQTLMQSTLEAQRAELRAHADAEGRVSANLMAPREMKEAEAEATGHLRHLGERLAPMRAWLPRLAAAHELRSRRRRGAAGGRA
jgi:hypothetical protein